MNWIGLIGDLAVSIGASSIWGVIGLFIYRKEKANRRDLAWFSLYSGVDRIGDTLEDVAAEVAKLQTTIDCDYLGGENESPRLRNLNRLEVLLSRQLAALPVEWLVSNLPRETQGLVWSFDLAFVVGNAHELANEINTVKWRVGDGESVMDCSENLASLAEVSADLVEAIRGQQETIPEDKRSVMG